MELDEQYVYVTYMEVSNCYKRQKVAAIKRDDFQLGHDITYVVDVFETVICYIIECDDASDPVIMFIENGHSVDDLELLNAPMEVVKVTNDGEHSICISWRLCLYSISGRS